MKVWQWRPRQPFTGLIIPAVAGVISADWFESPLPPLLAVVAALATWCLLRRSTSGCWLFIFAAFFALHTVRHHGSNARALAENFGDGARVARVAGIVWSDPEPPAFFSRTIRARFILRLTSVEFEEGLRWKGNALIQVAWAGALPVAYGDRVELSGTGENLAPVRNPGQFDFTSHLHRKGIYSELRSRFPSDCRIVEHDCGNPAQAFAIRSARWIKQQLERDLEDSPEITSLIAALIMMSQGSGPVKGFATMLAVGVFTSVFSAMLVSQVLLGLWFRTVRPKQLPI
ncbi:MAG: DUF4131 domain-containing protein [Verrucomicrobiota bacterium]